MKLKSPSFSLDNPILLLQLHISIYYSKKELFSSPGLYFSILSTHRKQHTFLHISVIISFGHSSNHFIFIHRFFFVLFLFPCLRLSFYKLPCNKLFFVAFSRSTRSFHLQFCIKTFLRCHTKVKIKASTDSLVQNIHFLLSSDVVPSSCHFLSFLFAHCICSQSCTRMVYLSVLSRFSPYRDLL